MQVNWGNAIAWRHKSELEGYVEELSGGPDWITLLAPATREDFIGNHEQRAVITQWFDTRQARNDSGVLIVQGECGVGKTASVLVEAKLRNIRLIHMAADEARTGALMDTAIHLAMAQSTYLFLDDANILADESTGLTTLLRLIKECPKKALPLRVIVCLDSTIDKKLKPLLHVDKVVHVYMSRVAAVDAVPFLQKCATKLNQHVGYFDRCRIVHMSNGDVRKMIILMYMDSRDTRQQKARICSSPYEARDTLIRNATESGLVHCKAWIEQFYNLWPHHFQNGFACGLAEALSDADILLSVQQQQADDAIANDSGESDNCTEDPACLCYAAVSSVAFKNWGCLDTPATALSTLKPRIVRAAKMKKSSFGFY